ncbi:MAG: hypothetical protein ABR519_02415 [Bacteroidales bacterium]
MKKRNYLFQISAIIVAVVLMSGLSSCKKEDKPVQPELPPYESMIMDFSDFDQTPAQGKGIITEHDNFITAYVSVAFWHSITTTTMIIPALAYREMLTNAGDPEYIDDNTWVWTKQFGYQDLSYTATLTAVRLNNEEFSMEMKIASAAYPEQGVVWFDGVIRYDHTHALWNLYKYDEGEVKVIEAEWNKDFETGVSDLKYTYMETGSDEYGSYIIFGLNPALEYDAYYTVSLSSNTVNIEWDTESKAGRIKNPAYFEDNEWHCWNNMLVNIECPVM